MTNKSKNKNKIKRKKRIKKVLSQKVKRNSKRTSKRNSKRNSKRIKKTQNKRIMRGGSVLEQLDLLLEQEAAPAAASDPVLDKVQRSEERSSLPSSGASVLGQLDLLLAPEAAGEAASDPVPDQVQRSKARSGLPSSGASSGASVLGQLDLLLAREAAGYMTQLNEDNKMEWLESLIRLISMKPEGKGEYYEKEYDQMVRMLENIEKNNPEKQTREQSASVAATETHVAGKGQSLVEEFIKQLILLMGRQGSIRNLKELVGWLRPQMPGTSLDTISTLLGLIGRLVQPNAERELIKFLNIFMVGDNEIKSIEGIIFSGLYGLILHVVNVRDKRYIIKLTASRKKQKTTAESEIIRRVNKIDKSISPIFLFDHLFSDQDNYVLSFFLATSLGFREDFMANREAVQGAMKNVITSMAIPHLLKQLVQDTGGELRGAGFYMVGMEYIEGETLRKFWYETVLEGTSPGSDIKIKMVAKDLIRKINLLHEQGIYHCDLHAVNIIVKKNPSGSLEVRIIDFGEFKNAEKLVLPLASRNDELLQEDDKCSDRGGDDSPEWLVNHIIGHAGCEPLVPYIVENDPSGGPVTQEVSCE